MKKVLVTGNEKNADKINQAKHPSHHFLYYNPIDREHDVHW